MVFWKTLVLHSASQSIGLSEVWNCHLCNSTGTRISRIRLPPVSLVFLPQYPAKLRGNEESAQVKQLSRWNLWIKFPQKIAVSCNVARLPTCYYYGIFSLGSVGWAVNGGFDLDQVTSSFMAIWDSGRSFSILWHILQYLYKWMFPSHLQFNALPSQVFKMGSLTRSMCGDDPTTYEDMVSNHGVLRNKQPSFQEDLQLCWTHYLRQHSGAKPWKNNSRKWKQLQATKIVWTWFEGSTPSRSILNKNCYYVYLFVSFSLLCFGCVIHSFCSSFLVFFCCLLSSSQLLVWLS